MSDTLAPSLMPDTGQALRLFVESVRDYALLMLNPTGHIVSWNAGAQAIKGYAADEIIGRHFSCFYPPEDVAIGKPDRELQVASLAGRFEDFGWRVRKDGSLFWANVVITAVFDSRGTLIGYGKVTRDTTARLSAEQEMQSNAARLKTLVDTVLETIADGLVAMNDSGQIQFANPAFKKLFGLGSDDVSGRHIKQMIAPDFHGDVDRYMRAVHARDAYDPHLPSREVAGIRADGIRFPLELTIGEADYGGEPLFVCVFHNLSDRKRTEEQLVQSQKMETVGQLCGGIAHDFNNLLTVIIGNAEDLGDALHDRTDLRGMAERVRTAGERGAELTQRLLAFSRRQTLQPVKLDCNGLIGGMRQLLRRTLRENIDLQIDLSEEGRETFADPIQLESAIINLSLNAQDAMPQGGRLSITTSDAALDERYQAHNPDVRPGEYLAIAVSDNGVGMPPEVSEKAFEPFFTTKDVGKGSGLGLSMVYGFIKQSNGHVAIYSEPGLGTTIRMYLPVVGMTSVSESSEGNAAGAGPQGLVLVAEDDPFVRSYAVACLESLGYRVVAAVDGHEALARLSQGLEPHILFTDVVMPGGLNGWQLAEQAKLVRPQLKVLFTSGYALETLTDRGHLDPATRVLNKPYRRAELARHMKELMDEIAAG